MKTDLTPLPPSVSQWRHEHFPLGLGTRNPWSVQLTIPADLEQLQGELLQAGTDKKPYWGFLWPAARAMAELVFQARFPAETPVLELGCGCGLVGLAALAAGFPVTFSDNRPEALQLAAYNCQQNNLPTAQFQLIDWLSPGQPQPFPWIIASDVLYEEVFHQPLLDLMTHWLAPGGEIWLGDPGRPLMREFVRTAQNQGWEPTFYDDTMQERSFPVQGQFQLIVFQKENEPSA